MSIIYLSENANMLLKKYLMDKGHRICEIKKTNAVYGAVSSHADIYICSLSSGLVVSREQYHLIKDGLDHSKKRYDIGSSSLGYDYPDNVRYNAVQVGKYFIHNMKYTDPFLIETAKRNNLEMINVRQGYTKCNLVVVDERSAITSDEGMAKVLAENDMDILLISQGYVALEGFTYGFLGGTSGRVGNELLFNGDLSVHPDFDRIRNFIEGKGLRIKFFSEYQLEDIGSIIEV